MNGEKMLELAKEYTDEKVKEQDKLFLQQIMASNELKLRCSRRSLNAIFLSSVSMILWVTTLVFVIAIFLYFIK